MSERIKPCPFCGSPARVQKCKVQRPPGRVYYTVGCSHTGACPGEPRYGVSKPELPREVEKWNRRVMPTPGHERVMVLAECSCPLDGEVMGISTGCPVHGHLATDLLSAEMAIEQAKEVLKNRFLPSGRDAVEMIEKVEKILMRKEAP